MNVSIFNPKYKIIKVWSDPKIQCIQCHKNTLFLGLEDSVMIINEELHTTMIECNQSIICITPFKNAFILNRRFLYIHQLEEIHEFSCIAENGFIFNQKNNTLSRINHEFFQTKKTIQKPTPKDSSIQQQETMSTEIPLDMEQQKTRMLAYFSRNQCFPAKHRIKIYQTLLNLPNNTNAFHRLLSKSMHPQTQQFKLSYHLKQNTLLKNMEKYLVI